MPKTHLLLLLLAGKKMCFDYKKNWAVRTARHISFISPSPFGVLPYALRMQPMGEYVECRVSEKKVICPFNKFENSTYGKVK